MQPDFNSPGQQGFILSNELPAAFKEPGISGSEVVSAIAGEGKIMLQTLQRPGFTMRLHIFDFLKPQDIKGFQESGFLISFLALKNNIQYFIEGLGSLYLKAGHFAMFRSHGHPIRAIIEGGKEVRSFEISWSKEIVEQSTPYFPFLKQFVEQPLPEKSLVLGKSSTKARSRVLGLIHELLKNPYEEPVLELFYENKIRDLLLDMLVEKGRKPVKGLKTTKEDQEKMLAIGEMISTEINKKFPINSLARTAGMSEVKLKITFKEVFGKAIFEYQLAARMEEARKMLLENELTTKAIAAKVGYKNTTSFISKFKAHFGYAPGAIQK
ncbi:MAG TPA: AraC family transcriptional regulator [Puia sp.]|jgi:AraC-like DNA-binding protein|nr:AraC family transcriptional regulator [Puia sp.]